VILCGESGHGAIPASYRPVGHSQVVPVAMPVTVAPDWGMRTVTRTTIVNVGYKSTNFWVISAGTSRLLLDLGWPGTMDTLRANLARMGVPLGEIRYGLATHYHLDHAGLAQELKQAGMQLLVPDLQLPWIPRVVDHVKPADRFTPITLHDNHVITLDESRAVLASIGIAGEILHTPGHSPDSVSLLLDDGAVFTGDLTHPMVVTEAEAPVTNASWDLLRARGATTVYAGHGPVRPL
jgi:glyoxylase-like metal-dependent hydrolase (beta-lactamase superfamily II)